MIISIILSRLLKQSKCKYAISSIEYLGHVIDSDGIHLLNEKVRVIEDAPEPKSVSELKSFLGLVNYYSKSLPNLSIVLFPLYRLLRKNVKFKWTSEQRVSYNHHLYSFIRNWLSHDALPYGIGVVLTHRMEDGSEKPITYVSQTLSPAEKKYSQLEKEGVAITFSVKRFNQYLRG